MVLVIQSFGNKSEYRRAIFSIYSFFAHNATLVADARVIVFTDDVKFFETYLRDFAVTYSELNAQKISTMRGDIDFLHRMKIAEIEQALGFCNDRLLYFDSDTFFVKDASALLASISENTAVMHLFEYKFQTLRDTELPAGKTFQDFYQLIVNSEFQLPAGRKIRVSPEQISYNAGVIGLHISHSRFIPDVYKLTDQFYTGSLNHASEQYAFSVILQNNLYVVTCEDVVYHYWYRIKKKVVDGWLSDKITETFAQQSLTEKLGLTKKWSTILPGVIDNHILILQDAAIQSFHIGAFKTGFSFTVRAILKKPLDGKFLRDVAYHYKRYFQNLFRR